MQKSAYNDVRLWQTHFSIRRALQNLPVPEMVVEEIQCSRSYCWDGKKRFEDGSQLVITLAGEGRIRIAGTEHELLPGMVFMHNHNDPQVCYFYPPGAETAWRFLWFAFYGGNSATLVTEINHKYGYIFTPGLEAEAVRKLQRFRNSAGEIQLLSPFEGSDLVLNSIGELCKLQENRLHSYTGITLEVQNMIAADPSAELQVEKLAAHCHLSREHLSRIFCRETGISLHEYIIRFRLKTAVDLLCHTRLSLKEIAVKSGWQDYSNFYRLFIKRFHCSPQKIRSGERAVPAGEAVGVPLLEKSKYSI